MAEWDSQLLANTLLFIIMSQPFCYQYKYNNIKQQSYA